jgi:hypothetical protein
MDGVKSGVCCGREREGGCKRGKAAMTDTFREEQKLVEGLVKH